MEHLIPINILVGDRSYRVKIDPKDEEKVRKLAKTINDQIIEFKSRFAGKDMQDYLAMALLWYVTDSRESGEETPGLNEISDGLNTIERMLDTAQ